MTRQAEVILVHMADNYNQYGIRDLFNFYSRLDGLQIYPPMLVPLIEAGLVERVKVGREYEYFITDSGLEEAETILLSWFVNW